MESRRQPGPGCAGAVSRRRQAAFRCRNLSRARSRSMAVRSWRSISTARIKKPTRSTFAKARMDKATVRAKPALPWVREKPPFWSFEPASAVKFAPDLTGGFRVKWTWSATFGGKRRAGGDFGAPIGDFWKYRAWRGAGSPIRAALARFPGDVRRLFVAGT